MNRAAEDGRKLSLRSSDRILHHTVTESLTNIFVANVDLQHLVETAPSLFQKGLRPFGFSPNSHFLNTTRHTTTGCT